MRAIKCIAVVFFIGIFTTAAQSGYIRGGNYNRLGLQAKYAVLDINTDEISVESKEGLLGGFATRSRVFNNFGLVYGIDFLISNLEIDSRVLGQTVFEPAEFSIIGAEVNLLLSYNILEQHLAVDFGPSLLINSNLRVRNDGQRDNIIAGFNSLTAQDITEISRVTPLLSVALAGGFESVRFTIQYQYGLTNALNNLNSRNLEQIDATIGDFNGNISIFAAGIVFYL